MSNLSIQKIHYSKKSQCGYMQYYFADQKIITVDAYEHLFDQQPYVHFADDNQGTLEVYLNA